MSLCVNDKQTSHTVAVAMRAHHAADASGLATLLTLQQWSAVTLALRCTERPSTTARADRDLARRFAFMEPVAFRKTLQKFVFPGEVSPSPASQQLIAHSPRVCTHAHTHALTVAPGFAVPDNLELG